MEKMRGVIPPMITPFTESGEIDWEALETLVRFLAEHVDGLFITGSYGSGALMSVAERKAVAEAVARFAEGRVPVVVMVGTTNTADSVDLARHAAQIGAAAVSAVGPYYFTHNRDSIIGFYSDLVQAVDLPVYVYNNPKFQGYPMDLALISQLRQRGLFGIKDATFDILAHADYQRKLAPLGFDVVLGTEAMWLPARVLGCEAFIPGLGNAFPEICRRLHREGMAGDYEACRRTQFLVNEVREVMYLARSTQLAVYAMLEVRGIIRAFPRRPFIPAGEEEKKAIGAALRRLNVL